jgi:transcriptional regulator with XRE-family HTH domain
MADKKLTKAEMKEIKRKLRVESQKHIKKIADMIKAFREKQGMTQRQVAKKAGIFQQQYARIESGKYNFTLFTIVDIAYAMNATVEIKLVPLKGDK